MRRVIAYVAQSAGDWGGGSRSLYILLQHLDRDRFEPLVLFPRKGPILPELERQGIAYDVWGGLHEPQGYLSFARDYLRAVQYLRRKKVDLMHINHTCYWRPAEVLAARTLRIPIITHYRVIVKRPPAFIKHSSLIVANSSYTAAESKPADWPKAVVHNMVDVQRYDNARSIREELGLNTTDVVVTFIGQVRRIKGIEFFLELPRGIREGNVKFLIVGECRDPQQFPDAYKVEELNNRIAQDGRIHYLGYRDDVENIYCSSDIIIVPSQWQEPFGLINIEAGATRKPVVATRVGGIPEIITHGENGFLVDREDADALIAYTRKLISDPQLRKSMGESARRTVEDRFVHGPIRQLETVYECLITKKPFPAGVTVAAEAST